MSKSHLERLFDSARREPAPVPPPEFAAGVLRCLEREPAQQPLALFEQLEALFPRLAWATALLIAGCVLAELCLSAAGQGDLASGVAQLSEQWLFATKGF